MSPQIRPDSNNMSGDIPAFSSPAPSQVCLANFQEPVKQVRHSVLQAVKRRDFHRAIAILNRLIATHTASAADYNNRGLVYLWSGQAHKALIDFNRAIFLDPALASSYNNRANCYVAQGARESAIEDYDQAIDMDPFYVRARINRAVTLRELRQYDAAVNGFEEALLFRQFEGEILAERGRTYHLRGDWNVAIADYRRFLKIADDPQNQSKPVASSRVKQVLAWLSQLQIVA